MARHITVLLIHDDMEQEGVLLHMLAQVHGASYDVEVVHLLSDGCKRLEQKGIDVVLVCHSLISQAAPRTLKSIRSRYPNMPFVLLTQDEDEITQLTSLVGEPQEYIHVQEMSPRLIDVTLRYALEHKQCQEILRKTQGRLQFIIDSIKDFAIFSTDLNGAIDFWNSGAESVFGYSEYEIMGQPFDILFTDEDRMQGIPAREMRQAAEKGYATDERWHLKKGQGLFYASGMSRPIYDNTQDVIGFIKVARDLTERQIVQEQHESLLQSALDARAASEQANRLKEEFLALVAHEMRTPLASIVGFASMMTSKTMVWPRESMIEYAVIIEDEAQRMSGLIEQLTDHARQQSGTLKIEPQTISLESIVASAMPQLRALTTQHYLSVDLSAGLPRIDADPQRIAQVLTNLVGNAARYSPTQTRITIHAQTRGDSIQVDVIDEGQGIPPDQREQVFDPFHQVERSGTKGLGLGLALCKDLIERHRGTIWVQDYEGPGTIMSFTLPITEKR